MEFNDKPCEPFGEKLLDMVIPTQLSLKMPLVFRIVRTLASNGFLPETGNQDAELCMDEAVTNAMIHGNKLDPSKKVRVVIFADSERWAAVVEDEGDGFSPDKIAKPKGPESFFEETGFGIILMKGYADEIVYNQKGNKVRIMKLRKNEPTMQGK